jgi:anti-anti-sigma regulatory factor/HAMP domain-containing protein
MPRSLSSKIILSIAGLLTVLAVGVAALTYVQMRRATIEEQAKVLDVLNYTFEILLSQDAIVSLQRVTENSATIGGVRKIAIIDRHGKVLASSERSEVGQSSDAPRIHDLLERAVGGRMERETEDTIVIVQPLRGGRSAGGTAGDIAGVAEVTLGLPEIEGAARAAALRLLAISLGSYLVLFGLIAFVLRALVTGPVKKLAMAAQRFRDGDRSLRSNIRRADEIGLLSRTFDDMADEVDTILKGLEEQVASRTADLEKQRADLEKQRAELARALEELQIGTAARLVLAETVRELSTPVIKLHDRIVVMPLVGNIDVERGQQIERSLLAGIAVHKAREVILDLTGVPIVDTQVAAGLIRGARAAQMLGAGVTIVGIGPDVAQSIVSLGIDFSGITTRADLQHGLLAALLRLGLVVCPARENTNQGRRRS